jgi:hypothetical protein
MNTPAAKTLTQKSSCTKAKSAKQNKRQRAQSKSKSKRAQKENARQDKGYDRCIKYTCSTY